MDWKESQLSLEPDLERTPIVGSDLDPQPWCKRSFFLIILCTSSLIFVQSIFILLAGKPQPAPFPAGSNHAQAQGKRQIRKINLVKTL